MQEVRGGLLRADDAEVFGGRSIAPLPADKGSQGNYLVIVERETHPNRLALTFDFLVFVVLNVDVLISVATNPWPGGKAQVHSPAPNRGYPLVQGLGPSGGGQRRGRAQNERESEHSV